MHYGAIHTFDIANGAGVRLSLFVSGCTNACPGCFQPETWDFAYGEPFTKETEDKLIAELAKPMYDGLTVLGGEPMEPVNQRALLPFLKRVRAEVPGRTIWVYSGNRLDVELAPGGTRYTEVTDELLSLIDILVDGRFIEAQKDIRLRFKGSSNQRVIDMNATRRTGVLTVHEDYNA